MILGPCSKRWTIGIAPSAHQCSGLRPSTWHTRLSELARRTGARDQLRFRLRMERAPRMRFLAARHPTQGVQGPISCIRHRPLQRNFANGRLAFRLRRIPVTEALFGDCANQSAPEKSYSRRLSGHHGHGARMRVDHHGAWLEMVCRIQVTASVSALSAGRASPRSTTHSWS